MCYHTWHYPHTHTQSQEAKPSDPPESHTSTQSTQGSSEKTNIETDQELVAQVKRLREEKVAIEGELASLRTASSSEVKEKAELIASEKKYRSQVSLAESF